MPTLGEKDWELILPYLEENERLFGIPIDDLLTVNGVKKSYAEVYRKVQVVKLAVLAGQRQHATGGAVSGAETVAGSIRAGVCRFDPRRGRRGRIATLRCLEPSGNLVRDASGHLTYLASSEWRLGFIMEEWPDIAFRKTREHN